VNQSGQPVGNASPVTGNGSMNHVILPNSPQVPT